MSKENLVEETLTPVQFKVSAIKTIGNPRFGNNEDFILELYDGDKIVYELIVSSHCCFKVEISDLSEEKSDE